MLYYYFQCLFEKCPYSKKITPTSKSEIISHFKRHDYTELLEKSVQFRLIENKTERRSPDWLAENLLEFCVNEVSRN